MSPRLTRIPPLRDLLAIVIAYLSGLIVVLLLFMAGAVMRWHEQLCKRCGRDPKLRRQLVNSRADAVRWEAFASAHDERSHRAPDRIQQRRD